MDENKKLQMRKLRGKTKALFIHCYNSLRGLMTCHVEKRK